MVILAILGSLINPFLRSLRFPVETYQQDETTREEAETISANGTEQQPITVLITAYNNKAELERNLPIFLKQQYAVDYQIIVVCQSTDSETIDYLKRTAATNPRLYYTYIPESSRYMSRKKLQITLGVKAAKYEWIILTEPTCKPDNPFWLSAMSAQCQEPNHLVLGYVKLSEETKGVRRFENIRKAFYVLRRAQRSYGYRSHMPNVAFRKSDFLREQGFQGNLEYVRSEYDFLVNKYAQYGDTAVELAPNAWLTQEEPTDKSWHNANLYLQASRKSMKRVASMQALMFFDHLMPHLCLIVSIATLSIAIIDKNWILAGCAAFALLLLFLLRMVIAHRAIRHFDSSMSIIKLPFYEYGIVWRNLATKIRYWKADKNDFTSHKL